MFKNCERLTDVNALQNWDISNVESMSYMFCNCTNLEDKPSFYLKFNK